MVVELAVRTPPITQPLGTIALMTVDSMDSLDQGTPQIDPGLHLPEDFHPTCESDFSNFFYA